MTSCNIQVDTVKDIRVIILVGFSLLLSSMAYSREDDNNIRELERKNSIDLTIGGNGLLVSVNYNRIVLTKPNYFINTSVGVGSVLFSGGITIPHQVTFNLGKKSSFVELGVGGTIGVEKVMSLAIQRH